VGRRTIGWAALGVLVVGLGAVYGGVYDYAFLGWDDRVHTIDNPHIGETAYFWTHFEQGMYMPLSFSIWSVLFRLLGPSAAAFHLVNLLFHALGAVLVFLVLERLLEMGPRPRPSRPSRPSPWGFTARAHRALAAAFGAMLFAFHPLQVEPVSWITSLKDVSYAFFALLGLYAYLEHHRREGTAERRWYALSLASLALATLCKPAAVCLLFILVAVELFWLGRPLGRAARAVLPFLVVAAPATVANAISQQRLTLLYETPLLLRPLVALDSLGFYLYKLFWPLELLPAYERSPRWLIDSGTIHWSWLPAAAAAVALFRLRKRLPSLFFGALLFLCGVVLVLGLKNFAAQDNTTVYDRYVYLAMLGPAFLAAVAVLRARQPWQLGLGAVLLVALAAKSGVQTRYWKDDRTLWSTTLSQKPDSAVALVSLGLVESQQGHRERAVQLYRRAVEVKPHDVQAHNNLGAVLAEMGRLGEAGQHFQRAVEIDPKNVASLNNLSRFELQVGRLDRAEKLVRAVLERDPRHRDANLRLGEILLGTDRVAEALRHSERLLGSMPRDAEVLTLHGVACARAGLLERAIRAFRAALHIDPGYQAARDNLERALQERRGAEPTGPGAEP